MTDVPAPETQHEQPGERGRLTTAGLRTDDGGWWQLQVVQEADGAWTVHGPGAPGVTAMAMIGLAEAILVRAQ